MEFRLARFRFVFRTLDEVRIPQGKGANIFRGALGLALRRRDQCAYARLFEPVLDAGPSGLVDPPRPFVLRPHFTEGTRLPGRTSLCLDLHLFDLRVDFLPLLTAVFRDIADSGFGPGRARAELIGAEALEPLSIELTGLEEQVHRIRLEFMTPTELKAGGGVVSRPEFAVLIARVRDRVATLDRLYGTGEVSFDWNALAEQAGGVRLVSAEPRREHIARRSSRTGRVHPLGGFVGPVEYEGAIGPFMGLLRAGVWTGVGRQTVWGKGAYEVTVLS